MEKREYVNPQAEIVVLDRVCLFDEASDGGEGASLDIDFQEEEAEEK